MKEKVLSLQPFLSFISFSNDKESLKNKIMDEKAANQLLETLENEKVNLKADTGRNYKSVFRIMKRNPGAISRKHEEELNEIKRMIK